MGVQSCINLYFCMNLDSNDDEIMRLKHFSIIDFGFPGHNFFFGLFLFPFISGTKLCLTQYQTADSHI